MNAALGLLLGLVLVVVGLALLAGVVPWPGGTFWLDSLVTVVAGAIPVFLILIGIFLAWLEADELKTPKEEPEPEKPKPKAKKKGKK